MCIATDPANMAEALAMVESGMRIKREGKLATVISLASAMSMDVTITAPADRTQSGASGTRRRTA